MDSTSIRVGVISDTHDLLRESAIEALHGVDHILHVGDVCSPGILEELRGIAPLTTVCGNMDRFMDLPQEEVIELAGCLSLWQCHISTGYSFYWVHCRSCSIYCWKPTLATHRLRHCW